MAIDFSIVYVAFLIDEEKGAAFAGWAGKTPVGRMGRKTLLTPSTSINNTFVTGQTMFCAGGLKSMRALLLS